MILGTQWYVQNLELSDNAPLNAMLVLKSTSLLCITSIIFTSLFQAMHMVFLICMSTYLASTSSVSQSITDHDYGIILDGGSSGTKLKIYKWRVLDSRYDTVSTGAQLDERYTDVAAGRLDITLIESKKFKPGVSEIAYALHNVERYLLDILDRAAAVIPISHHRRTPLYFMATAGKSIIALYELNSNSSVMYVSNDMPHLRIRASTFKYNVNGMTMLTHTTISR